MQDRSHSILARWQHMDAILEASLDQLCGGHRGDAESENVGLHQVRVDIDSGQGCEAGRELGSLLMVLEEL